MNGVAKEGVSIYIGLEGRWIIDMWQNHSPYLNSTLFRENSSLRNILILFRYSRGFYEKYLILKLWRKMSKFDLLLST